MSVEVIAIALLFTFMFFILLVLLSNSKHPYITTAVCSGTGVIALIAVNLLSGFTGVNLGVNFFTAGVSVLLGIPGVITMLTIKLFI